MKLAKTSIDDCKVISLPAIGNEKGMLTFIEDAIHIPFEVRRVFYLYNIADGEVRGAHAHKELEQFLICVTESIDVLVDDGEKKKIFHLDSPSVGLYLPPMVWAEEYNFKRHSCCLVLASQPYLEEDYHRSYEEFLEAKGLLGSETTKDDVLI